MKPGSKELPLFEGTPDVRRTQGARGGRDGRRRRAGTFDVQVGTAHGTVKLADYDRYNPQKLPASVFAPTGAHVRVSLARAGAGAGPPRRPLRTRPTRSRDRLRPSRGCRCGSSRPRGGARRARRADRQVLALVGNYEAASGGLDRATQSRRQPGSTFKPIVYSYAIHSRRFTPATLIDVTPAVFEGNYRPANYEGWASDRPPAAARGAREQRERRRRARARGRGPGERRRVGARARDPLGDEARPVARARELRGAADRARAARTRRSRPAGTYEEPRLITQHRRGPTARTSRSDPLPRRAACSTRPRRTS